MSLYEFLFRSVFLLSIIGSSSQSFPMLISFLLSCSRIRCLNVDLFLREHLSIGYIKILGNNSSVDALLQKRIRYRFFRQIFPPNHMFCSLVTSSK